MNTALLNHLPMKLDSLILRGELREGCRVVRVCEGAGSTSTQSSTISRTLHKVLRPTFCLAYGKMSISQRWWP